MSAQLITRPTTICRYSVHGLTTQTSFPFPLCIGFAGHIGLLGRCSGMLNSKNETSFTGSLLTAALGSSHHCLFLGACPLRYENTLGFTLTDLSVELLELSSSSACLMSMNRLRGLPLAVSVFSGGVPTCFASYDRQPIRLHPSEDLGTSL